MAGMHEDEAVTQLTLAAKAKVNLRLVVGGPRSDGYHEIASVIHQIALADEVSVSVAFPAPGALDQGRPGGSGFEEDAGTSIEVRCSTHPELGGCGNIAYRAASLYLAAWRTAWRGAGRRPWGASPAVTVDIAKRIPVAAGLGGGSSDAAAVLVALDRLLGPGAPLARRVDLGALAARVGSDVPFFLAGGAAFVAGRGEKVSPLQTDLALPLLLAVPAFGVSAGDAYGWWDDDRGPGARTQDSYPGRQAGDLEGCQPGALLLETLLRPGFVRNDLTAPVARRFPVVGELIAALSAGRAAAAGMTGSGPVVFGIYQDESAAAGAEALLRQRYPGVEFLRSRLDPVPTAGSYGRGR